MSILNWFKRFWAWLFGSEPEGEGNLEGVQGFNFSKKEIEAGTWFQENFRDDIEKVLDGTPYTFPLVLAIAMQETSYMWMGYIGKMQPAEVLALCVGDTIDSRSAFPTSKRDLLSADNGDSMFGIAREALELISKYDKVYAKVAQNPNKFCHGFGIFQYDIQFYKNNPDFFLEKRWHDFSECLKVLLTELREAERRAFRQEKSELTPLEMTYIAIAYNSGRVKMNGSLKQGFKDDGGRYYGENIWRFLQLAAQLPPYVPKAPPQPVEPQPAPAEPVPLGQPPAAPAPAPAGASQPPAEPAPPPMVAPAAVAQPAPADVAQPAAPATPEPASDPGPARQT